MKKLIGSLFVVGLMSCSLAAAGDALLDKVGVKLDKTQEEAARNLSEMAVSRGTEKLLGTNPEETKEVAKSVTNLIFGEKKKTFWQKLRDLFKKN